MHKPILFLGGMCGDLILTLIDPTSIIKKNFVKDFSNCKIKKSRRLMKSFWKYDLNQKKMYYERFSKINKNFYTITHDTEYCKNLDNVIQIYCSDQDRIHWISRRFKKFNTPDIVERVCDQQGFDLDNFENRYTELIANWQNSFVFKNRFDIKNIQTYKFIDDIEDYFGVKFADQTKNIYESWIKLNML